MLPKCVVERQLTDKIGNGGEEPLAKGAIRRLFLEALFYTIPSRCLSVERSTACFSYQTGSLRNANYVARPFQLHQEAAEDQGAHLSI